MDGDLQMTMFHQLGNLVLHENGVVLFIKMTNFTLRSLHQLSLMSLCNILDFNPTDHYQYSTYQHQNSYLFILAATPEHALGETEHIQHMLAVYSMILQPEEGVQWI